MSSNSETIYRTKTESCGEKSLIPEGLIATRTGKINEVQVTKGIVARIEELTIQNHPDAEAVSVTMLDPNGVVLLRRCECSVSDCTCVVESCGDGESIYCDCTDACGSNNFGCR